MQKFSENTCPCPLSDFSTTLSFLNKGEGGQSFRAGVETQAITAGPSNPLRISSPVGNLDMMGPQSVNLASFAGPITLEAYDIISLRSKGRGNVS